VKEQQARRPHVYELDPLRAVTARNQMGKVERRLLRMREQARTAACKVEHAVFVS